MIQEKIKTRDEIALLCKKLRQNCKKIGFTSGAFDILHAGHADYLEKAKALCDVLIVGVNTDASVRQYKGGERPIVSEEQRMKLVAALGSVDYVFLFNERRNQKNIEKLKPNLYIKAGDYKPENMTSKEIVEKFGGQIKIIPIMEQISTTDLITNIRKSEGRHSNQFIDDEGAIHIQRKKQKQAPAVFLDRDGTINEELMYLHEPEKFKLLPNVLEGLKKFQDMGYRIVIVTNQPGIGLGYYTKEDFYRVNHVMLTTFSQEGILVDKIYYCPHSKSEGCGCRKPGQDLIIRAQSELNLDLANSIFIGDKTTDIETGRRAGMKTVLVETGFKGEDGEFPGEPNFRSADLLDVAEKILTLERRE